MMMNPLNFISCIFFLNLFLSEPTIINTPQEDDCKVVMETINKTYEGECKKGLANGEGVAVGIDQYTGQFKKGVPDGKGKYTWANGDVYDGNWKNGVKDGEGKLMRSEGLTLTGYWIEDEYIGTEKVPYQVIQKSGDILRVGFRKAADEPNRVETKFLQNHSELPVRITSANGGFSVLPPNTTHPVFIVPVENFPFQGYLQFDIPGTLSNTVISNVDLEFKISQSGSWVVTVEMLATN